MSQPYSRCHSFGPLSVGPRELTLRKTSPSARPADVSERGVRAQAVFKTALTDGVDEPRQESEQSQEDIEAVLYPCREVCQPPCTVQYSSQVQSIGQSRQGPFGLTRTVRLQ